MIQTDIINGLAVVLLVLILTQIIKLSIDLPAVFVPFTAWLIALLFSVFISHSDDLPAGIYMGLLYGAAAVGIYASAKTFWLVYRYKKEKNSRYQ